MKSVITNWETETSDANRGRRRACVPTSPGERQGRSVLKSTACHAGLELTVFTGSVDTDLFRIDFVCSLLSHRFQTPHWTFPASSGDFSRKGGGHSVGRGVGTQWRSHFAWLMKEHRRRKTITHSWRSLACLVCVFLEIGKKRWSAACIWNTIQHQKNNKSIKSQFGLFSYQCLPQPSKYYSVSFAIDLKKKNPNTWQQVITLFTRQLFVKEVDLPPLKSWQSLWKQREHV